MLRRNFQQADDGAKQLTLDDAFLLTNAACTEPTDHVRAFARNELGWEVWKNPRLASPVAREIFQFRENSTASPIAVYGTLLVVIKNGLGEELLPETPLVKMAHMACFNNNPDNRATAAQTIIRLLDEAQVQTGPYTYTSEIPLPVAVQDN